jgi:hypothetical protein
MGGNIMEGKETINAVAGAFSALDKARKDAEVELVNAANQALGAELFQYVSFSRDMHRITINLQARIPCNNPGFWEDGLAWN